MAELTNTESADVRQSGDVLEWMARFLDVGGSLDIGRDGHLQVGIQYYGNSAENSMIACQMVRELDEAPDRAGRVSAIIDSLIAAQASQGEAA